MRVLAEWEEDGERQVEVFASVEVARQFRKTYLNIDEARTFQMYEVGRVIM